jgi:hypothetical protein
MLTEPIKRASTLHIKKKAMRNFGTDRFASTGASARVASVFTIRVKAMPPRMTGAIAATIIRVRSKC